MRAGRDTRGDAYQRARIRFLGGPARARGASLT